MKNRLFLFSTIIITIILSLSLSIISINIFYPDNSSSTNITQLENEIDSLSNSYNELIALIQNSTNEVNTLKEELNKTKEGSAKQETILQEFSKKYTELLEYKSQLEVLSNKMTQLENTINSGTSNESLAIRFNKLNDFFFGDKALIVNNLIDPSTFIENTSFTGPMTESGIVERKDSSNLCSGLVYLTEGTYYLRFLYSTASSVCSFGVNPERYPVGALSIYNPSSATNVIFDGITDYSFGYRIIELSFEITYPQWIGIVSQMGNGKYKDVLFLSKYNFTNQDLFVPYGVNFLHNTNVNLYLDDINSSLNSIKNSISKFSSANSPLFGKSIAYFGDSLMAGLELNGNGHISNITGGIWKRLNEKYALNMTANLSEGGTIIQNTSKKSISNKIANFDFSNTDICLFTGGFNDAYKIINNPNDSLYQIGSVNPCDYSVSNDWSSIVSSLESAIVSAKKSNPNLTIVWIKTWKSSGCSSPNVYNTISSVFDAIESVCNKYSIPVCDLWENSNINLCLTSDLSSFGRKNYSSENSYTFDGVHLSSEGYDKVTNYISGFLNSLF